MGRRVTSEQRAPRFKRLQSPMPQLRNSTAPSQNPVCNNEDNRGEAATVLPSLDLDEEAWTRSISSNSTDGGTRCTEIPPRWGVFPPASLRSPVVVS
eukprot:CAMPEP_0176418202 /NCGR_PEP_ID=MMETSP0127-20121128/7330_1 /TAXON_ID=938130 /ORGANISM="Platyophrya macrostoma, Strain WH" /LENGTH=96 /DNA_ID=CAMNT_0017798481 /DNA_START=258 /DNA_END=549 /DNA_ORIENTATION=-